MIIQSAIQPKKMADIMKEKLNPPRLGVQKNQ